MHTAQTLGISPLRPSNFLTKRGRMIYYKFYFYSYRICVVSQSLLLNKCLQPHSYSENCVRYIKDGQNPKLNK